MNDTIIDTINSILDVELTESETTVTVIESLIEAYDKALVITESCCDSELFQEGSIIDNVKKQGENDGNKLITIIKFIPRLIIELVKQLKNRLKRNPEGLTKSQVEAVHRKVDEILESTKDSKEGIGLNDIAGLSLVVLGAGMIGVRVSKNIAKRQITKKQLNSDKKKIADITGEPSDGKSDRTILVFSKSKGKTEYILPDIIKMNKKLDELEKAIDKLGPGKDIKKLKVKDAEKRMFLWTEYLHDMSLYISEGKTSGLGSSCRAIKPEDLDEYYKSLVKTGEKFSKVLEKYSECINVNIDPNDNTIPQKVHLKYTELQRDISNRITSFNEGLDDFLFAINALCKYHSNNATGNSRQSEASDKRSD